VGTVHYDAQNDPVVLPLANLDSLRLLRLFVYPTDEPVLTPVPPAINPAFRGTGTGLASKITGHHH
jgi:hypothetical protein